MILRRRMRAASAGGTAGADRHRRGHRVGGVLCTASLLVAVAGCGSSSKSASTSPATTAAAAATTAAPTTAAAGTSASATTAGSSATTAGSTAPAASGASTPSTATGGSTASDGSTIKIGYLGPQSGALASTFAAELEGIQTYVKYWNDQGGVNGHKLDLSVYDTQSNASAVLTTARKAVGDGNQALITQDVYFDTAAPYLSQQKVPVFGFGITLGFYGPDKQTFFSPMGNWIAYQSNVGMKYLVDQGHTKIAVLSDPNPGNANAAHAIAKAVSTVGGQLIYENYAVDDTNSAALLAVAQRAKDAGAQAVYTNFYGTAPAQLQANLNQISANAVVLNGSMGFSPDIPKQFGPSVEGLTSEVFTATWLSPDIPGVKQYMDAMNKYDPASLENNSALTGWATMSLFGGALAKLGAQAPTRDSIAAAANTLKAFDGDGLMQPVTFPDMHESMAPCMSFGQIQNGAWKLTAGTATSPLICGTPVAASG
jgi:branched-chain amino acid transport system substrate-binding protein